MPSPSRSPSQLLRLCLSLSLSEPVPEPVAEARGEDLRLKEGMKRTNASFMGKLTSIFSRKGDVDDDVMDELEDLLTADVGVRLAMEMVDDLRDRVLQKN